LHGFGTCQAGRSCAAREGPDLADTLQQGPLEVYRPTVLLQEIGEGLVGEFLEIPHAVSGEQVEGVPGLLIELNALARQRGIIATSIWDSISPWNW
jgi:hypothetical protein